MSSENENKKEDRPEAEKPVRKSRYEGRENLLLGKGEKDSIEKAVMEKGAIEKEIIEKEKKSGEWKEKFSGIDSNGIKSFLLANYKYIKINSSKVEPCESEFDRSSPAAERVM